MNKNFKNHKTLFSSLKAEWSKLMPDWQKIARTIALNCDPQYTLTGTQKAEDPDIDIDDPTAAISVNQAGDYLWGIIWGNGDGVISLVPSEECKELALELGEDLTKYFEWRTRRLLDRMNDSNAGLSSCGKAYSYDESGFGTGGLGAYPNQNFIDGVEENMFIFRNYGVDNLIIDEGKNGKVEIIFVPHRWRINRIVSEFCMKNGVVNEKALSRLPGDMKKAYEDGDNTQKFVIIQGIVPREDYSPKLLGKRGARYRGIWFTEDSDKPFFEEDYVRMPIGVCRAIKVRGSVYGRAYGTMLISTIRAVNYIVGKVIEVIEKQASPALGMWGDAIQGDKALDTSPDELVVFNPEFRQDNGSPVFPLHDVGDPSAIIKFLIPYLNDKITTGFKIDILLDFNDKSSKTATEMIQRAVIRDRALAGMLQQQKDECLNPLIHRCISIEDMLNHSGVNRKVLPKVADKLISAGNVERIIPNAVLACKERGLPWYKIQWNNALDKLSKSEKLDALLKLLNVITALQAMNPMIVEAIDWYKMLQDFKDCLNSQTGAIKTADEFKQAVINAAQQQQEIMKLQAMQAGSQIARNMAGANKDEALAKEGGKVKV